MIRVNSINFMPPSKWSFGPITGVRAKYPKRPNFKS